MTNLNQGLVETIINHMGGYNKLQSTISAYDFVRGSDFVGFKFKGSETASIIDIRLESIGVYEIRLSNISKDYKYTNVYQQSGLRIFQVITAFEKETGLNLRLGAND